MAEKRSSERPSEPAGPLGSTPPQGRAHPAVGFGSTCVGALALGVLVGQWLDRKYGTGTRYTLLGAGLAFVLSGYELWKLIRLMNRRSAEDAARRAARSEEEAAEVEARRLAQQERWEEELRVWEESWEGDDEREQGREGDS